jgi:zinc protease
MKSVRPRVSCALIIAILGLYSGARGASSPAKPLTAPPLKYDKYKLANGLEVILHENHRLPLVAVDMWYHVGPRNEKQGATGFAHLFEHMMFEGSEHVGEKAHIRFLESAGATDVNGTTDFDRTNYFETVPSNQLELALWLESDRMGFLLEGLDRARLANQRDVVRNERRQSVEGQPYQLAEEQLFHMLFPKAHPYYADVIGSHADIEAARLNDVRAFFQHYYAPNNSTIAIAGDFDTAKLKPLLEKYFGPIPAGPPVEKVELQTRPITSEEHATVTDAVQLPRLSVAWLTSPAFQTGNAEAELIDQILGGGKSSRLYRKLVYQDQIAQEVECTTQSLALTSISLCNVTARPGVKPEALEAAFDKEVDDLRSHGPTQPELERARNIILARKIEGLQRLGGFGGIADMMNLYNQYVGDPGYLQKDIDRYENATVASVQAVIQQQFGKNQRAVVYTVHGKKVVNDVPRSPSEADAAVKVKEPYTKEFESAQSWRKTAPSASGVMPRLRLPVPSVFALANGLKVYLVEDHALPVMNARVVTLAGAEANPANKPGTAAFAARMLTEGTSKRTATQVADDSDQIGAKLKCDADEDSAQASISALSNNADAALEVASDITEHPTFQKQEVERVRQEREAAILQEGDRPFSAVLRVARKVLYGEGPYAYPPSGTTAAVRATTRDDLAGFWAAHYAPQNAALVLTGDISQAEAHRLAEKYFGNWTASGQVKQTQIPQAPDPPKRHVVIVDMPGAPQTALGALGVGLPRTTPDYAAVDVMNNVLGGMFSSRLNMNLREKNGFTYGAFSFFWFHRGPGPFLAGAQVRTDATAPAAKELFAELGRIQTEPPTAAELKLGQDYALRSLPGQFDTVSATSKLISELFVYNLPTDYYRLLPSQYDATTAANVQRVALEDVHPQNLILVAVGDKAKIQPGLEKLNLGPIEVRDATGDLVPSGATPAATGRQ